MPRSFLLLKLMLLGINVRIQSHALPTGKVNIENWNRHRIGWKMLYNELVESCGSLIEYGKYTVNGEVPTVTMGRSGLLVRLKRELLFQIDNKSLALAPT